MKRRQGTWKTAEEGGRYFRMVKSDAGDVSPESNRSASEISPTETKIKPRQWTIEQETGLFKAICRFKPAGQHKHFRMLCIYQMVNNANVTPTSPDGPLSMAEIWRKLGTLYNLEGLDELEDSSSFMASEEDLSEKTPDPPGFEALGGMLGDGTFLRDFSLPWTEYGALIENQARDTSENGTGTDDEKEGGTLKRERSLSIESRHTEELEDEIHESDRASEAGSARATPAAIGTPTPKANPAKRAKTPLSTRKTAAATRATRSTRQRASTAKKPTKKEATAIASPSPTAANEEGEETNTEHSDKETSPPPANRTKRGASRSNKMEPKSKATPSRRSSRRK